MSKQEKVLDRSRQVSKKWLFGVCAVLVVAGGVWFSKTETGKLATSRQPDRFTELYFENPASLPKTITAEQNHTHSFVIVNREAKTYTYGYQIIVTDRQGKHKYLPVRVTVNNGARAVQQFSYRPTVAGSDVTVTVTLLNKGQSITFHTKS